MPENRERRRDPRVPVSGRCRGERTFWSAVRLWDISRDGVQLSGSLPLGVSEIAELRTAFVAVPFASPIEIRWIRETAPGSASGACVFGARFRSLDERSSQILDRFLRASD